MDILITILTAFISGAMATALGLQVASARFIAESRCTALRKIGVQITQGTEM